MCSWHRSHSYHASAGFLSHFTWAHRRTWNAPQYGHGTSNFRWSDSWYAASIRLASAIVGVEIITIIRLAKVPVRLMAKSTGSPSSVPEPPLDADVGYASTSSIRRYTARLFARIRAAG
jgi:hypothetical protein